MILRYSLLWFVLAIIAILFTSTSCTLLIIRFAFNIKSHFIYILSEWIIAIDIYSNFLFITLTYSYLNDIYYKICGICDQKCESFWYRIYAMSASNRTSRKMNSHSFNPSVNETIMKDIIDSNAVKEEDIQDK